MKIEIAEETFLRLQAVARPLVDSVDDVINRLIDLSHKQGDRKMAQPTHTSAPRALSELRGLQRELWELVIQPMPTTRFTLRDVYARKEPIAKLRPQVQDLEASIRAALEKLRDKGLLEFVDNQGTYRRLA